ncbi:APC family permease [Acidicapsa dinghuensis]|uniref:APC family permease n=1 Tax=Acidicapsa dinghuensis TaxID=2218256 RepID=A0ABW1EH50_9BACT|nr:APC family permease [Acidicapsa dinghuensis]
MSTAPIPQSGNAPSAPQMKRELGLVDLTLFYLASGLSLRWIATAAASGPSSIIVWIWAWAFFFVPLAASVLELSSRYPQEGGLYVWAQRAFGDFSGFMAAWTYWMSNLPYFPAILYFAAGSALFAAGPHGKALADQSGYFMVFSLTALGLITFLNIIGVKPGKWLNNAGAIGSVIPLTVLIVLGVLSFRRSGSATHFTLPLMSPHLSVKNAIFWSTIFYAFAGVESASCMGDEIKDSRRTIPRALIFAGVLITIGYILGTLSMLVAMPSEQINGLGGFMTATAQLCQNLGIPWLVVVIALMVTLSCLGAAGAYLTATARLPFVAGIDNYLPAAFGRVHPKWDTPYVAVFFYGLAGMLFAFLSQAATSVKGAYDVMVSMSVITYFIPYLFLFASTLRLQREPMGPEVIRVPGGKPVAVVLAWIGLLSTVITIGLSILPSDDEPNKPLAMFKTIGLTIILLAIGGLLYYLGKRRQARTLVLQTSTSATKSLLSDSLE